jgi:p-aminobenzoyl-glutamate transporter AbgT
VSLTLKVGMGSRACSRNSNMLGVIMVSSGILCKVNQADNWALLAPYFLPVIVKIGILMKGL